MKTMTTSDDFLFRNIKWYHIVIFILFCIIIFLLSIPKNDCYVDFDKLEYLIENNSLTIPFIGDATTIGTAKSLYMSYRPGTRMFAQQMVDQVITCKT